MVDLQDGRTEYTLWPGMSPKRVLLILPMPDVLPVSAMPCYNGLKKSSMALSKSGWKLPESDADVFCLWNPQCYFKLTAMQVAERLLAGMQSGCGAVYSSNAIAQMMQPRS